MGFVLGIPSGLVPGLHINNFAAMLLALSPMLIGQGLTPYHMASIILASSISQTFFDAIPAIFLGAPDSDTALTVLPGQRLMLEGRGIEAVRLVLWEAQARWWWLSCWSCPYPGSSRPITII